MRTAHNRSSQASLYATTTDLVRSSQECIKVCTSQRIQRTTCARLAAACARLPGWPCPPRSSRSLRHRELGIFYAPFDKLPLHTSIHLGRGPVKTAFGMVAGGLHLSSYAVAWPGATPPFSTPGAGLLSSSPPGRPRVGNRKERRSEDHGRGGEGRDAEALAGTRYGPWRETGAVHAVGDFEQRSIYGGLRTAQ